MIKGTSDRVLPAKEAGSRSVAYHKVMVSIHGVEQKVVNGKQLADLIRLEHPAFGDEEAFPDRDLIQMSLSDKLLEGKTVISQSANDYVTGQYVIITDDISPDSQIRVWCSCSSYYWVFQFYNVENNVDIWGKAPERYIPKTKAGWEAFQKNQPMRNPDRRPGMCKHIMLLLALLMDNNTLLPAGGVANNFKANIRRFKQKERISKNEYDTLMKKYESDHRRLLTKRGVERTQVAGYGQLHKTNKAHVGWSRQLKWDPKRGHWRKGM